MELSWNDQYRKLIVGLDILGVRQLDQRLEVQLVGGLTTVAPRARYLTLVTWALASLYRRLLRDGGGELVLNDDIENETLTRLEFLVAAATKEGSRNEEHGSQNGIVGSDVYEAELKELADSDSAPVPSPRRPGVLNAYGSPIQGFGLLAGAKDGAPLALTPRGQDLVLRMAVPDDVQRLLFEGERIHRSNLDLLRVHLSLNRLTSAIGEREALLHALDVPTASGSEAHVERFRATRCWAIGHLAEQPADGDGLVDRAYSDLVLQRADSNIALLWAEVALRKRVHFALELLLAALTNTLEPDRGTTIETVVANLAEGLREQRPPEVLEAVIGEQPLVLSESWNALRKRLAADTFLDAPPRRNLSRLPPRWQLAVALCLLAATEAQTRGARESGLVRDRGREAMESTFQTVVEGGGQSIANVAADVLRGEVAARHLRHTMRKMSQRQS